ncbi:MAG: phosphoadenylyl-sulfate reductase [Candidatus Omnitrophica bacterium]|nr:phosphoadenylyl-sulfate reductase [Candidatus Omnitrophota bacterium]
MKNFNTKENLKELVEGLNFQEKIERSCRLIEDAYKEFGDSLVVANSLGKDSMVVWDLARRINPEIRGFIVTTRFKPKETVDFMQEVVADNPNLKVYKSDIEISDNLHKSDPDMCCELLKVVPTRQAIRDLDAKCWITGLRCTEGRTRTDFKEWEERDSGLIKLNPILLWKEREIWQYLAIYKVKVNPLYAKGYRSLGCLPCTHIASGENERAGRWVGTSKCGGECGIHTKPLKFAQSQEG